MAITLRAKKAVAISPSASTDTNIPLNSGWNTSFGDGNATYTPAPGDHVLVSYATGAASDTAPGVNTAGYSEIAELRANDNNDANLSVSHKIMGGTPDTTVQVSETESTNWAGAVIIEVRSGVDPTTPLDVAAVTATGLNTGRPNGGSITPTTAGTVCVAIGGGAAATGAAFTQSGSQLSNFLSANSAGSIDGMIGSGDFAWSSGAFDPVAWTGGSNTSADSWAAVTLALRPAPSGTNANASGALGATVTVSALDGGATGNGDATGALSTVTVSGLSGSATGDAEATGNLGATVTVTALTGSAGVSANASGAFGATVTSSAIGGSATGDAQAGGDIGATVTVSALTGSAGVSVEASGAFGATVTISALSGTAVGAAEASGALNTVTVSGLNGSATGDAAATGSLGATVTVSGLDGEAAGAAVATGAFGATVTLSPLTGSATAGAGSLDGDASGAFGATVSISGLGGDASGDAAASGALSTVMVSGLGGAASGDAAAAGSLGATLTLTALAATAAGNAAAAGAFGAVVTLSPFTGQAGVSVEASGAFGATVTLTTFGFFRLPGSLLSVVKRARIQQVTRRARIVDLTPRARILLVTGAFEIEQ